MTKQQRLAINGLTRDILDILDMDVPVNIDDLVTKLGGSISETEDVAYGAVRKIKDDAFEIRVNPCLPAASKRFAVAHELGHLFLDMGFLMDDEKWRNVDTDAWIS